MKTNLTRKKLHQANILLVALCITGIAGLTLASFLKLTTGQSAAVTRSQDWNATIPIVEAGIEEAMTHLNDNCTYTDIQHASTNWAADGWATTAYGYAKT